jgi:hypothetical protein
MILNTKEDFEKAILSGEEIKHKTVFYTGELSEKPVNLAIGTFDEKLGVYAGELRGQQAWVALKDGPKQMTWEKAKEWCEKQGGHLPSIDELTIAHLNKEAVNKALVEHGGEPFKEDDYYWSSSEYLSSGSWVLTLGSGYRIYGNKTAKYYERCFQLVENCF